LEPLWTLLEGKDAKKAWQYIWDLTESPSEVMRILRNRLQPVKVLSKKEIQPLIQALDDAGFAKREQAMKQLTELGPQAEAALREALQEKPSIEQEKRIQQILSGIKNFNSSISTKLLAEIRAIKLLEQIGTPEAKELLEELAKGAESALLTHEAKDALRRLHRK
jgi:DNA-directed RNA polymerase subunit F